MAGDTFPACLLGISQFLTKSAVHTRLALYLENYLAISENLFFFLMREVSTEIFQYIGSQSTERRCNLTATLVGRHILNETVLGALFRSRTCYLSYKGH